jgi:hypothetical protein
MKRSRARRIYTRWSTRGRKYMEFYCLTPNGIRAGYPSNYLLRSVARKARRGKRDRIVLLLTANRRYALRGVRPGARLAKVRRKLKLGRGFRVGANTWYFTANGPSQGLLKVRRGVIEEVGIADKTLTGSLRLKTRFLTSFRPYL